MGPGVADGVDAAGAEGVPEGAGAPNSDLTEALPGSEATGSFCGCAGV